MATTTVTTDNNNIVISNTSINNGDNVTINIAGVNTLNQVKNEDLLHRVQEQVSSSIENNIVDAVEISAIAITAAKNAMSIPDTNKITEIEVLKDRAKDTGLPMIDVNYSNPSFNSSQTSYNPNESKSDPRNPVQQQRKLELANSPQFISPYQTYNNSTSRSNLQDIISGSDLSVFFMFELPNFQDVLSNIPAYLRRKELTLIELDSVMSLGYSIVRDVFPVRSLGKSKPKSFTRGPTTIAGHIAFTIFVDDVLVRMRTQMQKGISDYQKSIVNSINSIKDLNDASVKNAELALKKANEDLAAARIDNASKTKRSELQAIVGQAQANLKSAKRLQLQPSPTDNQESMNNLQQQYNMLNQLLNAGSVYMLNQLLPFHILVMGTNEAGTFTKMMIKNVRIIDENQMQGVQQPNIVNKVTFAAEDMFPMVSGNAAGADFTSSAQNDENNLSTNKFSVYSGSQIMKDVVAMQQGVYRLKN